MSSAKACEYLLNIVLDLRLGRPLRGYIWMAVALGGVSHGGVYSPGVHLVHVTLLILHESSALLRIKK